MGTIEYSYKRGVVTVTADDGTVAEWPLAQFEADRAGCIAATGTGISNTPVLSDAEKLAQLEADNAALRKALIDSGKLTEADITAASEALKG